MFRALVLDQENGKIVNSIKSLEDDALPPGDVLIEVAYSSLNYKDGLAITGKGKIVNQYPMVPGIDLVGRVRESATADYKPGDSVIVTGWGVGERHWGGFSELARVNAGWVVPLPEGMDPRQAMAVGTAGFTAMLCVTALEDGGVTPEKGTVIVTGAAGGVGSVAVALLAERGYKVAAVTGRAETADYLRQLGASEVVTREEMSSKPRPLEKQRWAGAVDTVGGMILARVLAETLFDGTVAACGLAASVDLPTTVMPFILRNVRLQGVESVQTPFAKRKLAWQRLQQELPVSILNAMENVISLEQVPEYAERITLGQVKGRTIIDLKR